MLTEINVPDIQNRFLKSVAIFIMKKNGCING